MAAVAAGSEGAAVTVVGAGLAGSLAALALARRGLPVRLVAPQPPAGPEPLLAAATALSYGGMAGPAAARAWRRLERRHGRLGLHPSGLVLHRLPGPLAALPPPLLARLGSLLPFSRVDPLELAAALPAALAAAGVERRTGCLLALTPRPGGGWRLHLAEGTGAGAGGTVTASWLVLAAGAGGRRLLPEPPARLRCSWAGVLVLDRIPTGNPWLEQVRRGRIVQPWGWRRPELESRAPTLTAPAWVVDPGLAPHGEGVVLGQISLVPATPEPGPPPDPAWMEERLRQGLAELDPALAELPGRYAQVAVSFCSEGEALQGPRPLAPGLWGFSGFRGAFALVPEAAERLADGVAEQRRRDLQG